MTVDGMTPQGDASASAVVEPERSAEPRPSGVEVVASYTVLARTITAFGQVYDRTTGLAVIAGSPTPTSGQCDACDNSQTRRRRELSAPSLEQGTVEACLSHMADPLGTESGRRTVPSIK